MNINLREVICTSRDGDRFWRMNECYIRGSMIKYLRIPDEVIDQVKEEQKPNPQNKLNQRRDGKRPPQNNQQRKDGGGSGFYKQQRPNYNKN